MPPPADEVCEVIITAPDPDWLVEFTRRLVTDRLCASGHNFQPIRTIYRWQGQVHDRTEGRVALRTRRSLLPQHRRHFEVQLDGHRRTLRHPQILPAARAPLRDDPMRESCPRRGPPTRTSGTH